MMREREKTFYSRISLSSKKCFKYFFLFNFVFCLFQKEEEEEEEEEEESLVNNRLSENDNYLLLLTAEFKQFVSGFFIFCGQLVFFFVNCIIASSLLC